LRLELENAASAVLQHVHASDLQFQNMLKTMLGEVLLLDCLLTKALLAADAHENPQERHTVIVQVSPLGCRIDALIRRLELALEAPLCCTLGADMATEGVPEAICIGGHAGTSGHAGIRDTAILNCGEWATGSDRLGDCIDISSNVDPANTPHGPKDSATIMSALDHVPCHCCSLDEICLSQGRVQCVLYRPDGIPLILGLQSKDLTGRALCSLATSALGMTKDSFYLTSNGRNQQSSKANWQLSVHDAGQTVSFKTLTRYRGAGFKKSLSIEDLHNGQVRRNPKRSG